MSALASRPVLRVAVAGGGVAGCILASQLRKEPRVQVRVFEKRSQDALAPGLNLLLNHNGLSALRDTDAELEAAIRGRGHDIVGWSARMMTGRVLYDIPDAVEAGLADRRGVRARWDEVNAEVQKACWSSIEWGGAIGSYQYRDSAERGGAVVSTDNGDDEFDLLVGADGRYSAVRRHMEGGELPPTRFSPPAIADFRVVVAESQLEPSLRGVVHDMLRVYNAPDARALQPGGEFSHLAADEGFVAECMRGLARVGVMRIRPPPSATEGIAASEEEDLGQIGIWGNFRLPPGGAPIPAAAKTRDGLAALFTPREGVASLDPVGRLVWTILTDHAEQLHWTRKQETAQRIVDGTGHVLLLGDAAGAIYPSLGQGANLAIEDACAAAAVLRSFARAAVSAGADRVDVPAATRAIESLRLPRRSAVQSMSRDHAAHVAAAADEGRARSSGEGAGEGALASLASLAAQAEHQEASLRAETADWLGEAGGRFPRGTWRERLRTLWTGWPRVSAVEAAVRAEAEAAAARGAEEAARARAAAAAAAGVAAPLRVAATTATPEAFAPFGQVCRAEEDGLPFGAHDAQLEGLAGELRPDRDADGSGGGGAGGGGVGGSAPRLYLMELDGPRPLRFDRITHHKAVSQCLGALGQAPYEADFYLAVHAPAETPTLDGVRAFRVAPGTFVKLKPGTWHAGPLWAGPDTSRTFYNLELSDTNVVDHHTVRLTTEGHVEIEPAPPCAGAPW